RRAKNGTSGLAVYLHTTPGGDDRTLEVMGVLPESPGAQAGLLPGDHILEIDGTEVGRLLSQVEAEALLSGKVGDTLPLRVQRKHGAHPEQVELMLAEAPHELMTAELLAVHTATGEERKVALVELRAFRHGVGEAFKKRLAELRRSAGADLAGVVLDLRGNPGGEVDEALVVADLFVADGILTRTRGRGGRILREEKAHEAGTDRATPLVILQDRHTASAAELLTAALRDHGRATSVGERSYGKGTVQEIMGMPDGSVLKLTIARYFSPKDHKIDGVGVEPDVALSAKKRGAALDEALRSLGLSRA
ncbi:MAG: PDZ domain-containing protein, partial [Myxococcales bacterium]|nr:PDZ domain-containing protein [Myxococcales bacterium]